MPFGWLTRWKLGDNGCVITSYSIHYTKLYEMEFSLNLAPKAAATMDRVRLASELNELVKQFGGSADPAYKRLRNNFV